MPTLPATLKRLQLRQVMRLRQIGFFSMPFGIKGFLSPLQESSLNF